MWKGGEGIKEAVVRKKGRGKGGGGGFGDENGRGKSEEFGRTWRRKGAWKGGGVR